MWNIKKVFFFIIVLMSGLVFAQKYEKENHFLEEKVLKDHVELDNSENLNNPLKKKAIEALEDLENSENEEIDYEDETY